MINIKRGFSLIELLIASAIFVGAMTSVITLVFFCVNTFNYAFSIKLGNDAIRQVNDILIEKTANAQCLQDTNGGKELLIKGEGCSAVMYRIYIDKDRLVISGQNDEKRLITPSNITVVQLDNNVKIFDVQDNKFLALSINIIANSKERYQTKTEYKNAYSMR